MKAFTDEDKEAIFNGAAPKFAHPSCENNGNLFSEPGSNPNIRPTPKYYDINGQIINDWEEEQQKIDLQL
ncbi:hypothetical protein EKG38_08590 [Shewanella canadensis]|uniref:Uncharacterized protein n=1 Tax=Shewanella canadensis TaxID=271096 RepID=A0A431WTS6_9GAMM|nr:hypothetical protein [Shewanella canadensis]RTR38981.1 hypothetical protein EKG38_08590 [Shewanella canadensis]